MKYKKGFKYQTTDVEYYKTNITGKRVKTDYISLLSSGDLRIDKGYAWDGPSGPTIDTKTFMRGSLIHDALYELIRKELIDDKKKADQILYDICIEDGMWIVRAWLVLLFVRGFGKSSTLPKNIKKVLEAP